MKPSRIVLMLALTLPSAVLAAGGGGGGGGGSGGASGGHGGASAGAAVGPSRGMSSVGSPNAGSAGAGSTAISGVPSGPAQSGGLNNSGNDPSGVLNANKTQTPPGTVGLAPSNTGPAATGRTDALPRASRGTVNEPAAGTNSLGTAQPSDGATTGAAGPTVTKEQDSDAKIDQENQKLDRTVNNICKGC